MKEGYLSAQLISSPVHIFDNKQPLRAKKERKKACMQKPFNHTHVMKKKLRFQTSIQVR